MGQHFEILPVSRCSEQRLQAAAAEPSPDVNVLQAGRRECGHRAPVLRDENPSARLRLTEEGRKVTFQLVYRYCFHHKIVP